MSKGIADLTVALQTVQQTQLLQYYRILYTYCRLPKKKKCSTLSDEDRVPVAVRQKTTFRTGCVVSATKVASR